MKEFNNLGFIPDDDKIDLKSFPKLEVKVSESEGQKPEKDREKWGNSIEFLLSCIAMSVGLGNVWRFPYIAYQNGGGSFVIPYVIILILVGKPVFFLEMIMGQFSSRGTIKVYDCVPALRGIGIGQVFAVVCCTTYYSALIAITLRYFYDSFSSELPWTKCDSRWNESCYSTTSNETLNGAKSSVELYFYKEVLNSNDDFSQGIGLPNWNLVGFLALVWILTFLTLIKGIRSSGKASYITGVVPFIFLIIFLVRALTLPGAIDGIAYFFTPDWSAFLKPKIWYDACTQMFFSIGVFFATVVMFSSYNKFDHRILRDANIVTTMDTLTSLLAGSITFAIVGHLAKEQNVEIKDVIKGGPGLVFITYAETISNFPFWSQLFSVMFYTMIFILGMGTLLALTTVVSTVINDQFKSLKMWKITLCFSTINFMFSTIFLTPQGQKILDLVDEHGVQMIIFILAIFELYAFCYFYGVGRICKDVEFMLGYTPGKFWTICWRYITPTIMTVITIYFFATFDASDNEYPLVAQLIGWLLSAMGVIGLPIVLIMSIVKQKDIGVYEKLKKAFKPTTNWGPIDSASRAHYNNFINQN